MIIYTIHNCNTKTSQFNNKKYDWEQKNHDCSQSYNVLIYHKKWSAAGATP
jgi:hypothetical protein